MSKTLLLLLLLINAATAKSFDALTGDHQWILDTIIASIRHTDSASFESRNRGESLMYDHTNMTLAKRPHSPSLNHSRREFILEDTQMMNYSSTFAAKFRSDPSAKAHLCRIYIAPSTIPGAGLGVFAGVDMHEGDPVTPGDTIVPLRDLHWHNQVEEFSKNEFLWDEYIWSGTTFPEMAEPGHDIDGASFGIGAAPNCLFPLLNVEDGTRFSIKRDNAGLSPQHPAIGSFTPWHDRASHATRAINAGMELFVDYGYGYFSNGRQQLFGNIPFLDDFPRADTLLRKYLQVVESLDKQSKSSRKVEHKNSTKDDIYVLTKSILEIWPNRVLLALPEESTTVKKLVKEGGTATRDIERSHRPLADLFKHGSCLDSLRVGTTSVGRGAFATRFLNQGDIVAPIPLIHLPDRSVLDVYETGVWDNASATASRATDTPVHQQLLLNYCFGHRHSTLLLCPYGVVSAMVNHGSSNRANVRIEWSEKLSSKLEWKTKPLQEWAFNYQAGLAFDYVALRDIDEGEEILLDYGDEWQQAWEYHVAKWKPSDRRVDILNEDFDSILPTYDEWKWSMGDIHEDADAVNLWCRDIYRDMRGLPALEDVPTSWPCKVISRHNKVDGTELYTAEIVMRHQNNEDIEKEKMDVCYEEFDELLFNVPRDAFVFGGIYQHDDTREYTQTWSFRHDMRIPDRIMPEAWKNLILENQRATIRNERTQTYSEL